LGVRALTSTEVLDARVYRTAFLPALIALFVAAFALEDRPDPARSAVAADVFDHARAFEAVHARQHHVQDDEIEDLLVEARERFGAVCRLHDLVPIPLKWEGQECLDRLLVVDEKDSGGSVCHDLLQKQDSWGWAH